MRKERNEVLKISSQIKVSALIKTIILLVIIDVTVGIYIYWLEGSCLVHQSFIWKLYFSVIAITNMLFFYPIYYMYKERKEGKRSKFFVEKYLSCREITEVVPIKAYAYSNFIRNLTDTAKFFAIRTENSKLVEISIKFNHEQKERTLQLIDSRLFTYYYKIKKNDEKLLDE